MMKDSKEIKELTPEEQELLDQAIGNLQSFVETETTHYVFVEDIDDLDTLPEPKQTPD